MARLNSNRRGRLLGRLAATALLAIRAAMPAHAGTATVYNLGTLGGSISQGNAINSNGQVAGSSQAAGSTVYHAFLYSGTAGSGGAMADLGTLGGAESDG